MDRAESPADHERFRSATAPYRREIQAYCYRMLGSLHDAEDLAQETWVRAWRAFPRFDGAAVRPWLYRIATNACLNAIERAPVRKLPPAVVGPADPTAPLVAGGEHGWLEPYPDAWLEDLEQGPDARYGTLEGVALAFLAALQVLPVQQRAVLILRDVLGWQAADVAQTLGVSVAAANSSLQRARDSLKRHQKRRVFAPGPPTRAEQSLMKRLVAAWERADIPRLVALLQEDVVFTMPPILSWYRGRANIAAGLADKLLRGDARGRYRFAPARANGLPAFTVFEKAPKGRGHRPFGVLLVRLGRAKIAELTLFVGADLPKHFG